MTMPPPLRKLMLTAHVVLSVGFLGSVAAFFALAVAGLTSEDTRIVRAVYPAMAITTWLVVVPLCFASLATGLIQSLATPWGLFRHYWVLVKLLLTLITTVVLVLQTPGISHMAGVAAGGSISPLAFPELRFSQALHAGGGLLVLLVTTALSIYKPRGLTRYGWRKQQERGGSAS